MATGRVLLLFASDKDTLCHELLDFTVVAEEPSSPWQARSETTELLPRFDRQVDTYSPAAISAKDLVWKPPNSNLSLFGGLSFRLNRGHTMLVTGPNGSGKSSLGYLLAGIETPSAGSILVSGDCPSTRAASGEPQVRVAPADPDFVLAEATVSEELVRSERSALSAVDIDLLKSLLGVGSLENKNPFSLSWHQRRKVAALQAMAGAELAIFLDEPTAEISDLDVDRFVSVIEFCAAKGLIVICASNDLRLMKSKVFDVSISLPASTELIDSSEPLHADGSQVTSRINGTLEKDSGVIAWEEAANDWIANSGEFCLFWIRFVYPCLIEILNGCVELPAAARLIDLGCGTGLHTRAVRNLLSKAGIRITKTIGLDAIDHFIQVAKLDSANSDDEMFLHVDLADGAIDDILNDLIPEIDETALITAFFSLHDMPSLSVVSAMLARFKKRGAIFFGVVVSPSFIEQAAASNEFRLLTPPLNPGEMRDWDSWGPFKVSSDPGNSLVVPYFHRSTQHYVDMLKSVWGPVSLHRSNGTMSMENRDDGCRSDEILFLVSRAV